MAKHFSLFGGLGLPENITKHHYAIVAISGACTIAAHVGKAYFESRSQSKMMSKLEDAPEPSSHPGAAPKKKSRKNMERVTSSSELERENSGTNNDEEE